MVVRRTQDSNGAWCVVRGAWWIPVLVLVAGCFPTMQAARIENGLHVDVGAIVLGDQVRNGAPQGPDLMVYAAPFVGLSGWVELGLPFGVYAESDDLGGEDTQLLLWPYAKFSLVEPGGRDHLAMILQGAWMVPASVGVRYGRDLGAWEPYGGVSLVFSGGPAGDDPFVVRYQEKGQILAQFVVGAEARRGPVRPAVEAGVLVNRYREGAVLGDFGQPTVPRTLVDVFVGGRVRW